jgi:hypothetical protein
MSSIVFCVHAPTQSLRSWIIFGVQVMVDPQTTTIPEKLPQSGPTVPPSAQTQSLAIAEAASEPMLLSPSALVYDRSS